MRCAMKVAWLGSRGDLPARLRDRDRSPHGHPTGRSISITRAGRTQSIKLELRTWCTSHRCLGLRRPFERPLSTSAQRQAITNLKNLYVVMPEPGIAARTRPTPRLQFDRPDVPRRVQPTATSHSPSRQRCGASAASGLVLEEGSDDSTPRVRGGSRRRHRSSLSRPSDAGTAGRTAL